MLFFVCFCVRKKKRKYRRRKQSFPDISAPSLRRCTSFSCLPSTQRKNASQTSFFCFAGISSCFHPSSELSNREQRSQSAKTFILCTISMPFVKLQKTKHKVPWHGLSFLEISFCVLMMPKRFWGEREQQERANNNRNVKQFVDMKMRFLASRRNSPENNAST